MSSNLTRTLVYMLRHGEPDEAFHGRFYGQMDVPLSERGESQSHALAERLAGIPFDAVYSSDLQRSAFLAELLATPLDLPVRKLEVFRERALGIFQGLSEDEMRSRHPEEYARWKEDRLLHKLDGGETFAELQRRIVPAVQTLVRNFEGCRVALSCHAGPIRVALAQVLGMPVENALSFTLDFASVNVIEFPRDAPPRVKLVNG